MSLKKELLWGLWVNREPSILEIRHGFTSQPLSQQHGGATALQLKGVDGLTLRQG